MNNQDMIAKARAVAAPKSIGKYTTGDVGCALLAGNGQVYLGVCLDMPCGIGFCAEHSAVAAMTTAGEYRIVKVVAVRADGTVVPPCGRCRELIRQLDAANLETEVVLGADESVKLKELLPRPW